MSLVAHAETELRRAGLFDKDSDYDGATGPAVLALVKVFAEQGNSGASRALALDLFDRLTRFLPLMPLTGEDDEWTDRGEGLFQNRRCSRVFMRADGSAFDVGEDGPQPAMPVTFPYIPQV